MTKRISIEKVVLIRALHDFAPKVVAAGIGGLSASQVIALLALAHITVPLSAATLIVALVAAVCGYIKADTAILPSLDKADAAVESSPAAATATNLINAAAPVAAEAAQLARQTPLGSEVANVLGIGGRDASPTPVVTQG